MEPEITLEHCSVLLEKLEQALNLLTGHESSTFVREVDSSVMLDHYEEYFTPKHFSHLFTSDFGKNVLVGTFVQRLLERTRETFNEEESE